MFGYEIPLFFLMFILAIVVLQVAAMWKIFEKAGEEGWQAIIPIYNWYIMLKIVGKPGLWLLWFIVPIANLVFFIWTLNMLSKSFGKDEGFTVGLVFFRVIFYCILGFGSAKYLGPYGNRAAFDARNLADFGRPGNNQE